MGVIFLLDKQLAERLENVIRIEGNKHLKDRKTHIKNVLTCCAIFS